MLSLLEYYEREKLYFPKLVAKLSESNCVKQYNTWEADVADKIAVVQKALSENNKDWLAAPAVINKGQDASLNYNAGKKERTNYNRYWKFYDGVKKVTSCIISIQLFQAICRQYSQTTINNCCIRVCFHSILT